MEIHLRCYCNEIHRSQLDRIYKDTTAIVNKIKDYCSDGKENFLRSWVETKKIPSVHLSIKDHKPLQPNGHHPTHLIISAHNFTKCLSKLASKSIKRTFRHAEVNFERHTLKNLLALKCKLEEIDVNQGEVTIVSLDIKDMFPQCHFKAVQDAVQHYVSLLPNLSRSKIQLCLDILKFSMGNTIVTFCDKYYEYSVDPDPDRQVLLLEVLNLHS